MVEKKLRVVWGKPRREGVLVEEKREGVTW